MSSIHFVDTVTHVPAGWANDVDALVYDIFNGSQTKAEAIVALGLGDLSLQNASAVSITGGNIDGAVLGQTTPCVFVYATNIKVDGNPSDPNDAVNLLAMQNYVSSALAGGISSAVSTLGNMAYQNKNNVQIIGGILDSVVIGGNSPADGRFITLKMTNSPSEGDDVVTLGYLTSLYGPLFSALRSMAYQAKESVDITGGTIEGTSIGVVVPSEGRFTQGRVYAAPVIGSDIVNKNAMDTAISSSLAGLGSMAFQPATGVQITGGTIDNTIIGSLIPSTGTFSTLLVTQNNPWVRIRTDATTPTTADATLYFAEGGVDKGFISGIGGSNTVYPNSFINSIYAKANFKFILQGQSVQTFIDDADGMYIAWGADSSVSPILSSVPTLALGNQAGGLHGDGVIRVYSNGVYGAIQGSDGNVLLDASDNTHNIRIGSLTGGTIFNGTANPGTEKVYVAAGLGANEVRAVQLLSGDATPATTGILTSGASIKAQGATATQKNILMRLANNKASGSTEIQDTIAIDFCAGDATSITTPFDLGGETMAVSRICVPTASSTPSMYVEVSNGTDTMMRALQLHASGNVQVNPHIALNPPDDNFHALQVSTSAVAKGYNSNVYTVAGASGSITVTRLNGESQTIDLSGSVSVTLVVPVAPPATRQRMQLHFNQGASGSKAVTFTNTINWTNQSTPDTSTRPASFIDRIDVWTEDNGATWMGYWFGFGTGSLSGTVTEAWVGLQLAGYLPLTGGTLSGGLNVQADVNVLRNATPTTGYIYYGNSGSKYFGYDASQFVTNGNLYVAGTIYATGNITAFSDSRLKYDIRPMQNALDVVRAMRPCRFKMRADHLENSGFIADEIQALAPELVSSATVDGETYRTLAYGNITAYLAAALIELERSVVLRLEAIERKLATL